MSHQAVADGESRTAKIAVLDRRVSVRHVCSLEAVSRPLESPDGLCWGARIKTVSTGGVGLLLCYPFRAGSCLAVDVPGACEARSLLVKVVHVADQSDGTGRAAVAAAELEREPGEGEPGVDHLVQAGEVLVVRDVLPAPDRGRPAAAGHASRRRARPAGPGPVRPRPWPARAAAQRA